MSAEFKPPSWAGPGEAGLHLDVMKDGVLIGKYAIDKKVYYLFGRNPDAVDFAIDHVSCSRIHAALVHHKALQRPFLLDLGSTHGTFVGNIRLEANKPQQLFPDMSFHFGASSRHYFVKEKEKSAVQTTESGKEKEKEITLPTSQVELDTLTSYNTGQNLKLSDQIDAEMPKRFSTGKRKHVRVSFRDEEDIINLEDCDPSVGRFQNLVATEIVASTKRFKPDQRNASSVHRTSHPYTVSRGASKGASRGADLYGDLPTSSIVLPNSAPEVESSSSSSSFVNVDLEEHHKKYPKEVWAGRHPTSSSPVL